MKTSTTFLCLTLLLLSGFSFAQTDLNWPVYPDSTDHPLSATYGMYLGGIPPWMHSGLDIPAPTGTPVYAVKSGYMKTITAKFDYYSFWRIVIGDEPGIDTCEAFFYAHLLFESIPAVPFDTYIEAGTQIGTLVDWPFHENTNPHLHFSRIRYAGDSTQWAVGQDDWIFIANPLDFLDDVDSDVPFYENAFEDDLLAFCENESDTYFASGEAVSGDVDIICSVHDYHNLENSKKPPHSIEYKIDGATSVPWTMAVSFTDEFGIYDSMRHYIDVIFQQDATCNTQISYDPLVQETYYNITNNDGDTLVEPSDKALCWNTIDFYNGDYWVHVRAKDESGNTVEDSMSVTVENEFTLSGSVTLIGGNSVPEGAIVTTFPDGLSGVTDEAGLFSIEGIGGNSQTISFTRSVYDPVDTVFLMTKDTTVDITLTIGEHSCGDANGDGMVNVGDAVFVVTYVFKDGTAPDPACLADANGDGSCNIGDAVYVITYIFKGGDDPVAGCCE